MMFWLSLVLGTSVGQYPKQWHLVLFEERQDPVIEDIGRSDSVLSFIEFGECYPGIGIDKRLLIDPAYTFDVAHIVGILRSQVSGMLCFYFPKGLPFLLFTLHGNYLGFG